jgi:tricorn protease
MISHRLALCLTSLCLLAAGLVPASQAVANEAYFRFPTLAGEQIVFTAEGDLWSVPVTGGRASRLTTHAAEETNPVASPDGRQIAFAASYDGPVEVYIMPLAGGVPQRVTFDGGRAIPVGWTPANEVLYVGQNPSGPSGERIVTAVDPASLARHALPLAAANDAAVTEDGKTVYFTRFGLAYSNDNVKHYQGGLQSSLWRFELAGTGEAERLLDPPGAPPIGNDRRPMPWQDRVYFVSDRDGHANLWSMNATGGDRKQLTHHDNFEIREAGLSHGRIVYQLGADVHLFDIASGEDRAVAIDLVSDFAQQRPHILKHPLDFFEDAGFAPDGERVAVTARGHLALMGLGDLRRIDIAAPPAARVREAAPSPDGHWVYAILEGDGTGNPPAAGDAAAPQIWRFAADGSFDSKQLTTDDAGHRMMLAVSPDGKELAHASIDGRLFLLDLDTGSNAVIDTAPNADLADLAWSADSRHLAFIRSDSDLARGQLFLYEPATKRLEKLTSDRYESARPAFSPDGKWLYFLSARNFESSNAAPWGDRDMGPYFDKRTEIFALALQTGLRFPFQPRDELTPAKPATEGKSADPKAETKADPGPTPAEPKPSEAGPPVEWAGLADRLYRVPAPPGDYNDLGTDGKQLYFLEAPAQGGHTALKRLAIDDKAGKPEEYLGEVRQFAFSGDRKKLFLRRWADDNKVGDMLIVEAGEKPAASLDKAALDKATIHAGDWSLQIDPRQEWRQLFDDAWRLHRDYYYDQKMHDVDWLKVRAKFAPLVERVTDRDELNDVLGQMLAELGTLHSQIRPGDLRTAQDTAPPAFLGALFRREANGARVTHIYRTDPELPDERSPLARPGTDVKEGDLITEIDGAPVNFHEDIEVMLAGKAGQQVLLTLHRTEPAAAKDKKPAHREVKTIVTPVDAVANGRLRYADWETGRRDAVDKAGGGQIGYLHLRAMGKDDIAAFAREFYANLDRGGLIIDVRHNNGGNIDSWVIEKLLRRAWAYWTPRYGRHHDLNMQHSFRGHLAVLVDETTYSDGETFAAGIKALGLGPLIGKRTAGAGIWLSDDTRLADKGAARAAENPQFAAGTGEWLVENKGVEPDIDVENPPKASFDGGDAQLDAAMKYLQDKLAKEPVKKL